MKLPQVLFGSSCPFNRTSMESKPSLYTNAVKNTKLLIEPVWNRNFQCVIGLVSAKKLLIEPVWNRNPISDKNVIPPNILLIEPVWNRN